MRVPVGFFANWFKMRGRSFPWREEDVSPFGILLAEVLLKQTRAEMVAAVWPALYRKYPNAASLETESPEVLHQHISCLGLRPPEGDSAAPTFGSHKQSRRPTHPACRSDEAPVCRHILRSCSRLLRIWSSRAGSGLEHRSRPLATGRNRTAKRHQESSGGLGDCTDSLARQGGQGPQLRPAGLRRGHVQG